MNEASDPLFPAYIQSVDFPMALPEIDASIVPPDDLLIEDPQELVRMESKGRYWRPTMKPTKHFDDRPNGWDFLAALVFSFSGVVWLLFLAIMGIIAAAWYGMKGFMGWFWSAARQAWRGWMSRKGVGY